MSNFKHLGVMIDCSRNAVMKPSTIKKFIDLLALMGYNTVQLYTEDTYKIDTEDYFGYLRGAFTCEEIKDIDAYAKSKGIELIPCVQVLAHFDNLVKLPQYADIVDVNDILLVDEPRTYELIDKIFSTLSQNFTSRKVNIGMDEAHMLGLGKFLDKHGYQNRFDIILRHLNRVNEIALKYGFKVHMWSDMFFRLLNDGDYYGDNINITKEVIDKIPENVDLVYWDYYHDNVEFYDKMITAHEKTGKNLWFAGGVWSWVGFAPFNRRSLNHLEPAFKAVKKHNIENVLLTLWGDDGKECSYFSMLPTLYSARQFADGNFDMESIKEGFKKLFKLDFDNFLLLDNVNPTKNSLEKFEIENVCKSMLYNDCFLGVLDKDFEDVGGADFSKTANEIEKIQNDMGEFSYIFTCLSSLARVMEIKATLGIKTRKAYKENNIKELKNIIKLYKETEKRLEIFYRSFYDLWHNENKPFGWEVQDARLGGLMRRVKSCKERLIAYLKGKIDRIPELEETILPFGTDLLCINYKTTITTSKM